MNWENSFVDELTGVDEENCARRPIKDALYATCKPQLFPNSKLIHFSESVSDLLHWNQQEFHSNWPVLGLHQYDTSLHYYCMRYGGHQFGQWAGQLGDGRVHNLGEIVNEKNKRYSLQLKGSGLTPFSRNGDGKAVLRSSIREHLCSEAMFALGIPTSRSLYLAESGEEVMRDIMYDGNPKLEKGALVCRIAPSFIRFGNFQIPASNQEIDLLKQLADYAISHHFKHLEEMKDPDKYVAFYSEICESTIRLCVEWLRVGFVHGVLNTDNMSIHGITIDYGPYGWLDDYNPDWTPNTTDRAEKRYRFGNQVAIVFWNLVQLANSLFPLVKSAEPLQEIIDGFYEQFSVMYTDMMASKLGINPLLASTELLNELEKCLLLTQTDMTIFYRNLSNYQTDSFSDDEIISNILTPAFYHISSITDRIKEKWLHWFGHYKLAIEDSALDSENRRERMNRVNPKYIFRNYIAHEIIEKAEKGDYSLLENISELLKNPYDEQPEFEKWFVKRPDWAIEKIGSSMLSCSS